MPTNTKHLCLIFFAATLCFSCKTNKTFNGTAEIECPTYKDPLLDAEKKTTTKYRLILLKDGEKVFKKRKKGKSKLFKKKVL